MGRSGIAGGFPWVYLNGAKSISYGAFAFKPVAEHLHMAQELLYEVAVLK